MKRKGVRTDASESHERGLTLVEMLVSVMLLAFLALGSISLLTVSFTQNKLARKRSLATNLAAERLEHVTSLPFATAASFQNYRLPEETADAGPPRTLTAGYGMIPGCPEFSREVTLNYGVPVAGMLQVVSRVSWRDPRQGEKSHTLITYIHPGLEEGL
jgi:prepilin-type N-terminal cleavage/methylation domain-containing protein